MAKRELDEHAMRELSLYIDNDYPLYRQEQAIEKNLLAKMKRGSYRSELALRAWKYLIDAGAKKYCKEFGGSVREIFPAPERNALAEFYAKDFEQRVLG